ncbi:MAG TPA: DUF58 domain-containing protein [Actinomycetota bacterium]|nr:DUF58 domain-containing protein [Actinomycetota bacterium]
MAPPNERFRRFGALLRTSPTAANPALEAKVKLPSAERILREMEIQITKRLNGLNTGVHRSPFLGHGTELAEIREYLPGDDIRAIDWNVTARTGQPHVRTYETERDTSAFFLIDRSASMGFGTAAQTKEALLQQVVAGVSAMMLRRGDRIGGMLFGETRLAAMNFTSGRRAALRLLELLSQVKPEEGQGSRLDMALDEANMVVRRPCVIVVLSDWLGGGAWQEPLTRLAHRHEVIAVEVGDPREAYLPSVGPLILQDPETGRQLELDTSRPEVLLAYQAAAEKQIKVRLEEIAASGARHLVVSTDRDWLSDLTAFLARRRGAPKSSGAPVSWAAK